MKLLLSALFAFFMSMSAIATEVIAIQSPYSPSHSGTPAMYAILEKANIAQNQYRFILEHRPGGEQLLAVKALDQSPQNRLAIIAAKFAEHEKNGKLNSHDYVPVHALGDACWAVISNLGDSHQGIKSLEGHKEITVGGVGFGNAAHLTSLELGEKYNFSVRYIPFKSNTDALILMLSDGSINLVINPLSSYKSFKDKNPQINVLAMSCPVRHPDAPHIKTLKEQGINAPYIFNITVAHATMDRKKQQEISQILQDATIQVGLKEIQRLSDMSPPVFSQTDLKIYYTNSINLIKDLLEKHRKDIPQN